MPDDFGPRWRGDERSLPSIARDSCHSAFIPASFTTRPHLACSLTA
jgi:hypothetical protein